MLANAEDESGNPVGHQLRDSSGHQDQANAREVLLQSAEGRSFWAEITISPLLIKEVTHRLFVIRDISARKDFQAELTRQRDFLKNIINAVPDQLVVKSADHTIVLANAAFCQSNSLSLENSSNGGESSSAGASSNGVNNEPPRSPSAPDKETNSSPQHRLPWFFGPAGEGQSPDTIDAESERNIKELEDRLLVAGNCHSTLHAHPLADGSEAVVSVKRSVFADHQSGERYIVATSRDITEDRARETRLELLASVFNSATEGVAILDERGLILEANPAFLKMDFFPGHSPLGHSFFAALNLDADQETTESILEKLSCDAGWAGKGRDHRTGDQSRSYWVSLGVSSSQRTGQNRVVALVSDITAFETSQLELRRQALYDNLTGLPNRRYFCDYLEKLLQRSKVTRQSIVVCFLDLDDFKHVNDSTGHSTGDRLLQAVGKRIQSVIRERGVVARFGGDEFALILVENEQQTDAIQILDELLAAFREPFRLLEAEVIIGLSMGVTRFPEHGEDIETLMCNADIAMYVSKEGGKNQTHIFTPAMQESVNNRHQIQSKLRKALSEREITLYFQPKACAATGDIVGCEALARWKTPTGQFISPGEFVPIAEQTGLIVPLGEMVFRLAAEQACKWRAEGIHTSIAVNVSPKQLRHPRFIETMQATLVETAAKPDWFELEITEYAMMEDVENAINLIGQLHELGFRVAIDDFGTGYSSLSYLKNFRIHTLKVDLSFTRDVTHDPQSKAIVHSIVSLGNGLGLTTVAEGVETNEQAKVLRDIGCGVLQGYLIGKPMPCHEYVDWLVAQNKSKKTYGI